MPEMNAPPKVTIFLSMQFLLLVLLAGMFLHATYQFRQRAPEVLEQVALVNSLGLTDLCLFTEARYTRHPSMADLHSAFQDHPHALEHFPSGSLVGPPAHLVRSTINGMD